MLAISCAIDNKHVQMHAPCLWPADCWRVTEEQPGTQQPGRSCTGGLFQRPLQPPHGLQRRTASRSCAGLSSALQPPSNPSQVQTCPNSQACTDAPVYWTWPSNWLECTRRQRAASTASSETCFKALRVPGARLNAGHAALVELRVDDRQQAAQQRVILRHAHHLLPAHLPHLRGPPRGIGGQRALCKTGLLPMHHTRNIAQRCGT